MAQVSDLPKDWERPFELFSRVRELSPVIDVVAGKHQTNRGGVAVAGRSV